MKTGMLVLALLLVASSAPVTVGASEDDNRVTARLAPRNEVPAVSSPARGTFRAEIGDDGQAITYELRFDGLQADVTQAHLHFAQPNVNGGIVLWLCGTAALPGPAGTPLCGGPRTNTVSGTLTSANVVVVGPQGIGAGELSEVISAIRSGLVYANVHTAQSTGGEIRGQLKADD